MWMKRRSRKKNAGMKFTRRIVVSLACVLLVISECKTLSFVENVNLMCFSFIDALKMKWLIPLMWYITLLHKNHRVSNKIQKTSSLLFCTTGQQSSLSYLHSFCMANRWSCTSGTEVIYAKVWLEECLYAGLNVPCDTQSPIWSSQPGNGNGNNNTTSLDRNANALCCIIKCARLSFFTTRQSCV